jgi:hypothetical protein
MITESLPIRVWHSAFTVYRIPLWPLSPCVYGNSPFGLITLEAAADLTCRQEKIDSSGEDR